MVVSFFEVLAVAAVVVALPLVPSIFLSFMEVVTDTVELGAKRITWALARHGRKLHYLCMLMVGLFLGVCGWALLFEPLPY